MAPVVLYTTDRCPYCDRAKELLARRSVPFTEINLERDPEGRRALVARTGRMTFPQILVGDESIGGFSELVRADRAGLLRALKSAA